MNTTCPACGGSGFAQALLSDGRVVACKVVCCDGKAKCALCRGSGKVSREGGFLEALQQAIEGRKIRRSGWIPGVVVEFLPEKGMLLCRTYTPPDASDSIQVISYEVSIWDAQANDWEVA